MAFYFVQLSREPGNINIIIIKVKTVADTRIRIRATPKRLKSIAKFMGVA